jgi:RNA polymerase sigma-70 factor (ECF subfamily)
MKTNEAPRQAGLDPDRWIDDHGDYLFRYAMFRLRNREAAEDAVQEALLAAVQSHHSYQGRSSERTWLVAILRNKIVDHLRLSNRYAGIDFESEASFESLCFETEGKYAGHWRADHAPTLTGFQCDQMVAEKDFFATLDRCLRELPDRMATVFILKEIDGLSGDEICESLKLTKSNLWVLLHRARLQLRHLLEREWLSAKPAVAAMKASASMPRTSGSFSAVAGLR